MDSPAAPAFIDPYRAYWVELRANTISQIRLIRVVATKAPPEVGPFHRELIASLTGTVQVIERGIDCRPWDGT